MHLIVDGGISGTWIDPVVRIDTDPVDDVIAGIELTHRGLSSGTRAYKNLMKVDFMSLESCE